MFSWEVNKCQPHIYLFFYEMKWEGGPCLNHFQVRKNLPSWSDMTQFEVFNEVNAEHLNLFYLSPKAAAIFRGLVEG